MRAVFIPLFVGCISIGACSSNNGLFEPSLKDKQDSSQLSGAIQAVDLGIHGRAERILGNYVYRAKDGDLKMRYFGITGTNRKEAIDIVVSLLWETGRDETLKQFAGDYLSGTEYQTVLCRIAERQARYEDAYQCWNKMGEVDRAERVIRTEAAFRVLGTP